MPTIHANGLDIGYDVAGAGPPLVMLHGATTIGRRHVRGPDPARCATAFQALSARRARPRPDPLGRRATGSGPNGSSTTSPRSSTPSASTTFHLVGYSMGGDDRARVRDARARASCGRSWSSGSRPPASRGRRVDPPADGPGPHRRDDPAWAADLAATLDPVQGRGAWQRLLPAIADGRRDPAAAERRSSCAAITAPTLVVVRRPRPARPGAPGAGSRTRRSATGDCSSRRAPVTMSSTSSPDLVNEAPARASIVRPSRSPRAARRSRIGGAPMTTMLALFRRPEGGPEAQATFERRYAEEHLPLVAATPGLRAVRVRRVTQALARRRDALPRHGDGLRRSSGAGRRRSRPTRCAPPAATCARSRPAWPRSYVLEDVPEMDAAASPGVDTVGTKPRSARDRDRAVERPADDRSPRERPRGSSASRSRRRLRPPPRPRPTLDGVALVTLDRPGGAQRAQLRPARRARRRARGARRATRPVGRSSSPGPGTRAFAAGADIRELAPQTSASLDGRRPVRRVGPAGGGRAAAHRGGPRASPSAAAASWRWPAT